VKRAHRGIASAVLLLAFQLTATAATAQSNSPAHGASRSESDAAAIEREIDRRALENADAYAHGRPEPYPSGAAAVAQGLRQKASAALLRGEIAAADAGYRQAIALGDGWSAGQLCSLYRRDPRFGKSPAQANQECAALSAQAVAAARGQPGPTVEQRKPAAHADDLNFLCKTKNTEAANPNSGVSLSVNSTTSMVSTGYYIPFKTGKNVLCRVRYVDGTQDVVIQRAPASDPDDGLLASIGNAFTTPLCYTYNPDGLTTDDDSHGQRAQFVKIEGETVSFGMAGSRDRLLGRLPAVSYALNLKTGTLLRNSEPFGRCTRQPPAK
jgi:hypothetical protein